MSSNIFGYQGVNTPLESLTNGRYNVADYTTLRETVDARLSVLEKDQAQPTNVVVSGSLTVAASNTQSGFITAAGNGSFGGNIICSGNASVSGGMSIAGNLAVNGLSGIVSSGPVIANGGIQFSDLSIQTSALIPLISGSYTNSNIVVNNAGVISSVSSGVGTGAFQYDTTYSNASIIINRPEMDLIYYNLDTTIPIDACAFTFSSYVIGQRVTILRAAQDLGSGCSWVWNSVPYRVILKSGTEYPLTSIGSASCPINPTVSGVQQIRSVWLVGRAGSGLYAFTLWQIS